MSWAPLPWGKYFFPSLNVRGVSIVNLTGPGCSFIFEVMRLLLSTMQNWVIRCTIFLELPPSEGRHMCFTHAILMEYSFVCCHSHVYLRPCKQAHDGWYLLDVLCARSLTISVILCLIIWRVWMLLLSVYSSRASSMAVQHLWRKS